MQIFSPSGGLSYHYLAYRYKKSLWNNFRQALGRWLMDWQPKERNIILVGPSGGYNLPTEFLLKFEQVIIFDPDLLAEFIFKRNHRKLKNIKWIKKDILGLKDLSPRKLGSVLSDYNDHAVLFCNVIGQLPLLLKNIHKHSPEAVETYMLDLGDELKMLSQKKSVSSFHDVYSRRTTGEDGHVLRDHLTMSYFISPTEKSILIWNLSPKEEHQIGLVRFS